MARTSRGVLHPIFLGALTLLVVNDHLLKGQGWLPAWLTGKLSDFAGLVVAPVVLATALGAFVRCALGRSHWVRRRLEHVGADGTNRLIAGASTTTVSLVFVATELSQAAADRVAALFGSLGFPSRLHADATDLVALAVLPVTWSVLVGAARTEGAIRPSALSSALERVSFALATVACVATAPQPTTWTTSAYLVNGTDGPIDVRIRWLNARLACAELQGRSLSMLVAPELLTPGLTFRVDLGATAPLDQWAALGARAGLDGGLGPTPPPSLASEGCAVALLAVDDAPDTLVLWSTERSLAVPLSTRSGELPSTGRVDVIARGEELAFEVSNDVRAESHDPRNPPTRCEPRADVGWSDPESFDGPALEVAARVDGGDGCVRLDFAMGARTTPFFVCAPAELVPFVAGDVVRVEASERAGVYRAALVGSRATLVLLRARTATSSGIAVAEGGVTLSLGEPDPCGGERLACGSFVAPHRPVVSGGAGDEDARGIVRRTSSNGRAMRIAVPRAERVLVASSACAEGRDVPGPLLDAVVLYE